MPLLKNNVFVADAFGTVEDDVGFVGQPGQRG